MTDVRKKTCFISGKFNVLHPGHLRLFRHAKEIADKLVVGVYVNSFAGEGEILVSDTERLEGVKANMWVDEVFLVDDLEESIRNLKPEIVLKGKEHERNFNLEKQVVEQVGGVLKFAGGDTRLSASALIKGEQNSGTGVGHQGRDFLKRHDCDPMLLGEFIQSFEAQRVLVVGDLMVDQYIDCHPLGMSAEDPTVVVSPFADRAFLGGAGIIAAHAAKLSGDATLLSVCGEDAVGQQAARDLEAVGVNTVLCVDSDRPTTLKKRYRASGKTLLRVNELRDHQIDRGMAEKLFEAAKNHLSETDVLIFADFSYGVLSDELIDEILNAAKGRDLILAADSQSSSQIGDISRFKNVTLLSPTEREARLAVRDNKSGLIGISEKLREVTNAQYIPITLASEGVFLHRPEAIGGEWTDDQVPALNLNPADVSGAGDAFLVSTALALAVGADIWSSIFIGSVASACQVARIGNVPLSRNELLTKVQT